MTRPICRRCGSRENIEWHWVAHSPEQFIPLCKTCHKREHELDPSLDVEFPDWKITTITVRKGTKVRLQRLGRFGETWDTLLNRLIDELEEYERVKQKWGRLLRG